MFLFWLGSGGGGSGVAPCPAGVVDVFQRLFHGEAALGDGGVV